MMIVMITLSYLNYSWSDEGIMVKTSALYTTYNDDHKHFSIESCLNYSCSDEGLTLETSAPYTTYGDDHKHFNFELSKLQCLLADVLILLSSLKLNDSTSGIWGAFFICTFTITYVRFGNLGLFASFPMLMSSKKAEIAACPWLLVIRLTNFYGSFKR